MISSAKLPGKSLPVTAAKRQLIDHLYAGRTNFFDSIVINDVKLFLSGGIAACKRRGCGKLKNLT